MSQLVSFVQFLNEMSVVQAFWIVFPLSMILGVGAALLQYKLRQPRPEWKAIWKGSRGILATPQDGAVAYQGILDNDPTFLPSATAWTVDRACQEMGIAPSARSRIFRQLGL